MGWIRAACHIIHILAFLSHFSLSALFRRACGVGAARNRKPDRPHLRAHLLSGLLPGSGGSVSCLKECDNISGMDFSIPPVSGHSSLDRKTRRRERLDPGRGQLFQPQTGSPWGGRRCFRLGAGCAVVLRMRTILRISPFIPNPLLFSFFFCAKASLLQVRSSLESFS